MPTQMRKTLLRPRKRESAGKQKKPPRQDGKILRGGFRCAGGIQMAGLSMLPSASVSVRKLFALAASKVIPPRLWSDFASER